MNPETFILPLSFLAFGGILAFLTTAYLWLNPLDLTGENVPSKIYPIAFDVYVFGSSAAIVGLISLLGILIGHLFGVRGI